MPIANDQHVVRVCNSSAVDPETRKPLPVAFTFRQHEDGSWKETYLSVFWLEHLHPNAQGAQAQLAAFRQYANGNPPFPIPKFSKKGALAVLPVGAIHAASAEKTGTVLECRHEPRGDGDGHSGIHPSPGVEHWPTTGNAAAHLAVRQYLWEEAMNYWEDTYPPA